MKKEKLKKETLDVSNPAINDQEVSQPSEKEAEKKLDKQLYWILGIMVSLILVFLASSYIFQQLSKFEYEGMTFTKEKFGEIPLFRYSYYVSVTPPTGNAIAENPPIVNLYLLEDP